MKNYLYPIWCPKCEEEDNCYKQSETPECFIEKLNIEKGRLYLFDDEGNYIKPRKEGE